MKAAILHSFGKPPRCEEFSNPVAEENELIVQVRAAALKPVDQQMANGSHYASPPALPFVCGIDGVGHLEDGARVYFAGSRFPYGAMAQHTVVSRNRCFPLRHDLDDVTAAALINPGVSAWLSLTSCAKLVRGESVLVLGATGVTGKLAVRIAKLLGAGRVVAAGRNQQVLSELHESVADGTVSITNDDHDLRQSFVREAGSSGFHVILDYIWGHPTEVLLNSMIQKEFVAVKSETRLVQAGESAGPTVALPAAVLRSCPLTIRGTAGIPPHDVLTDAFQQVTSRAARGELRIDVERVPLTNVENAWQRQEHGRRLVLIP
ncbi:MAG TPA: zinc-binding alcohol dehydrogenase family protein [Terriglobales bacterium]|nr:zinc-binding alcohol dehydrogenase family protein [Terriglobales bacterium]